LIVFFKKISASKTEQHSFGFEDKQQNPLHGV